MAQRDPKKMSDDELFHDWKSTVERSYDEMIVLGSSRDTFDMMRDIVGRNRRLRETGGYLLDWIFGNYAVAAAMTFRREIDGTQGQSLRQMLHEIEARPTVLSRTRYRKEWGSASGGVWAADKAFDSFKPRRVRGNRAADYINPTLVKRHREELLRGTQPVKLFVERTMAHRSWERAASVTWGQLHRALDRLERIFRRYYTLLTQGSLSSTRPIEQFDEYECFTFPWLTPRDPRTQPWLDGRRAFRQPSGA